MKLKKLFWAVSLILNLCSCSDLEELPFDSSSPSDVVNTRVTTNERFDLLGHGYNVTSAYLNPKSGRESVLDIDKLNLIVISSSTYWYYDKELSLTGYEKDEFNTYFNNKKELLEPVLLHPDKYVYLTKEDIINEYDEQKKEAINYFKKIKEVNRIVGKNKR